MDEFTKELIALAYRTCKGRKRCKSDPVTVDELIQQMGRHWVNYRDGTIAIWADRLLNIASPQEADRDRLLGLIGEIDARLMHCGVYWELPGDDDPIEYIAQFGAYGIAVLWWIYHEGTDVAPIPQYTREEIAAWLSQRQLCQLPLFQLQFQEQEMET